MLGFPHLFSIAATVADFGADMALLAAGHKWATHGPVAGSPIGCNCSHFECQNIVSNWRSEAFKNRKWGRMCESQECCGCENCIEHPSFPSKPKTMTECYDCKDCSHCQYCDKCMYMPDTPDLLCSVLKVLPMTGMNNGSGNPRGDECETGGHKAIHNMNWGHRKGALGANFNALDVGMAFPRPVMLTGTWTNYDYEGYKVYISANGLDWDYVNTFKGNATFDPPINRVKDAQYRGIYFARVAWEYTDGPSNNWVPGIWFQFTGKKCPGHLCQEKGGPNKLPSTEDVLPPTTEDQPEPPVTPPTTESPAGWYAGKPATKTEGGDPCSATCEAKGLVCNPAPGLLSESDYKTLFEALIGGEEIATLPVQYTSTMNGDELVKAIAPFEFSIHLKTQQAIEAYGEDGARLMQRSYPAAPADATGIDCAAAIGDLGQNSGIAAAASANVTRVCPCMEEGTSVTPMPKKLTRDKSLVQVGGDERVEKTLRNQLNQALKDLLRNLASPK